MLYHIFLTLLLAGTPLVSADMSKQALAQEEHEALQALDEDFDIDALLSEDTTDEDEQDSDNATSFDDNSDDLDVDVTDLTEQSTEKQTESTKAVDVDTLLSELEEQYDPALINGEVDINALLSDDSEETDDETQIKTSVTSDTNHLPDLPTDSTRLRSKPHTAVTTKTGEATQTDVDEFLAQFPDDTQTKAAEDLGKELDSVADSFAQAKQEVGISNVLKEKEKKSEDETSVTVDFTKALEETEDTPITDETEAQKFLEEVLAQELTRQQAALAEKQDVSDENATEQPQQKEVSDPTKPKVVLDKESAQLGFPKESASIETKTEKIPLPEDVDDFKLITPEESAAAKEHAKKDKMDAAKEALKEEAKKIAASGKENNIFAKSLQGLREAGVYLGENENGFGMTGRFDLWDDQYLRMTGMVKAGEMLYRGERSAIKFGNFLSMSGRGRDGKYGTPDDGVIGEMRINEKVAQLWCSSSIKILDNLAETDFLLNQEGIALFSHMIFLGAFQTKVLAAVTGIENLHMCSPLGALDLVNQSVLGVNRTVNATKDAFKNTMEEGKKKAPQKKDVESIIPGEQAVEDIKHTTKSFKHNAETGAKATGNAVLAGSTTAVTQAAKVGKKLIPHLTKDFDIAFAGAMEADFVKFLDGQAQEAVKTLSKFTSQGFGKAKEEVKKLEKLIRKGEHKLQNVLKKEFHKAERVYNRKTRNARKLIEPVQKQIRTLEKQVTKITSAIRSIRRKLVAGREKTLRRLRKAKDRVNKASNEVKHAKKKLKNARGKVKWYKPWTWAVVVYWATRVAVVEAARWAAEAVLNAIMYATNIFPIDAVPPLPVMWASYATAYTALKSSYATLSGLKVATNPLAMKEVAIMAGLGVAIATMRIRLLQLRAALLVAQATLEAAKQAAIGAGGAMSFGMDVLGEALKVMQGVIPIMITGAGVRFTLQDTIRGKLPDLSLTCRVFGKRRIVGMSIDLARMDRFVVNFLKSIGGIFHHKNSWNGVDVMEEIETMRKKFIQDEIVIEKQLIEAQQEEKKWNHKKEMHKKEVTKLEAEKEKILASIDKRQNMMKKGEGLYGKTVDLEKAMSEEFDTSNPTRYRTKKAMNTFRWWDQWQLPQKDSGALLFTTNASQELHIGLHTEATTDRSTRTFDILLGGWEGTRSAIRDKNRTILISSDDTDALPIRSTGSLDDAFAYWVSYHHGYIAVGRGREPGQRIMLEWQVENPPKDISFFSFSTQDSEVLYEQISTTQAFHRPFGSRYSIYDGARQFSWSSAWRLPALSSGTITFKAKAAHDLIIGLTNDINKNYGRYLVALGSEQNKQSSLIAVSENGKQYNYHTISQDEDALIHNKDEYASYWVTLDKEHFAVGAGQDPTQNLLMEYLNPEPLEDISHFSFSSWDNGIEIRNIAAQPAVEIPVGSKYSAVNRKMTYEWREPWQLPATGKGTVTWRGKGIQDMLVGLHTRLDETDPTKATYHVLIGADNNTRTVIKDSDENIIAQTRDTEAVIAERNNYNHYWLTYNEGYIALGTGTDPGEDIVLEYDGVNEPITHFSFSNNTGFVEYQHIGARPAYKVQRGSQFTAKEKNFSYTWRSEWKMPENDGGVVVVRARAQQDIVFALSADASASARTCDVDIVIGANDNTNSVLRRKGQRVMHTAQEQTIVDAQNFYTYWFSYNKPTGIISCGRGAQPGTNLIISATLVEKPLLTHFSLSGGAEPVYYKDIATYALDDTKRLSTRAKRDSQKKSFQVVNEHAAYTWLESWQLNKPDSGTVIFDAKAHSDICIGLTHDTKAEKAAYEVVIGGDRNRTTTMAQDGIIVASSSDADALITKPGNYYTYWVSYRKGHLALGRGKEPGQRIMLEWYTSKPSHTGITHFALSGKKTPVTYRKVGRADITQKMPVYHTYSADHRNGSFAKVKQWRLHDLEEGYITFFAKAERDVLIGLSKDKKTDPTYVITVGANNNTQSTISKEKVKEIRKKPIARITDGKKYQPYWLLYNRGFIKVGHGTSPSNESTILSWQDLLPTQIMQYFSLSSADNQVSYHSIASQSLEKARDQLIQNMYTASAQGKTFAFANSMKLPSQNSGTVSFAAQGKKGVRVGFTNGKNKTINPPYEVVIGAHDNSATIIKRNGREVARSTSPHGRIIFPDAPNEYWVTLKPNGKISVGSGSNPSMGTFLSWQDPSPITDIEYFAFSSDKHMIRYTGIAVQAPVKPKELLSYEARDKNGKYSFRDSWKLPAAHKGSALIEAQGEKDIMIGFCEKMKTNPIYDVVIGAHNNTQTIIRKNGKPVVVNSDKKALITDKLVPAHYWISFDNGTLSVGKGVTVGQDLILAWSDPEPHTSPLTCFGLSNGMGLVNYSSVKAGAAYELAPYSYYYATARQGTYEWHNNWRLPQSGTLTFTANAPHADLRIGFNMVMNGKPLYEIRLGGWRNTLSAVLKDGKKIATNKASIKLIEKPYWISFSNNRIAAGRGKPGSKVLLDTSFPEARAPRYFSFTSGSDTVTYTDITVDTTPTWPGAQDIDTTAGTKPLEIIDATSAARKKQEPRKEQAFVDTGFEAEAEALIGNRSAYLEATRAKAAPAA